VNEGVSVCVFSVVFLVTTPAYESSKYE